MWTKSLHFADKEGQKILQHSVDVIYGISPSAFQTGGTHEQQGLDDDGGAVLDAVDGWIGWAYLRFLPFSTAEAWTRTVSQQDQGQEGQGVCPSGRQEKKEYDCTL